MAIDPIVLALCRGENVVGDTTMPIVRIDTVLKLGETVELSRNEIIALGTTWDSYRPVALLCTIEGIGTLMPACAWVEGYTYSGTVCILGSMIEVYLKGDKEKGTFAATVSGYQIAPIE